MSKELRSAEILIRHVKEVDEISQRVRDRINERLLDNSLIDRYDGFFDLVEVKVGESKFWVYKGLIAMIETALEDQKEEIVGAALKATKMIRRIM